MADENKQFEATPHKLKKVREEGQSFKSQDLTSAVILIVLFGTLFYLAPRIFAEMQTLFIQVFEQIPNQRLEEVGWQYLALLTLKSLVLILLPFLAIAFITAIAINVLQVGPLFTTKVLEPKFDKLNPVNGFKNIFSMRTAVELVKNLLKILILGVVGYLVFTEFLGKLLLVGQSENIFSIMTVLGAFILKFTLLAGIAFLVIAGGDFLFQRWKFLKDQKMSFKELKDEFKNTEGDPMIKQALRQRRMQMLQQRMLEAVPTADVITTNPTHIAVAIGYNADEREAPTVLAKGTELFAERIKEIARAHNIPIVENPTVARSLFRLVDVDQEIPPNLYQAVAEILLFAWKLRGKAIPTSSSQGFSE